MSFRLIDATDVPDYSGAGFLYEHTKSGAQIFHLRNEDPENFFAYAFKTLPADSTGVAHILEHTVLSGSERYPLKDPFLHLMKGSVNTFLNAMTYPDKTVYPAASPVAKDLFHLMRVYGDAVFFPLLKRELFAQEGHRLQFTTDGLLERSGVVYNEMKGAYSSHDNIAAEQCYQSLFPDTLYRYDSGGNPLHIPDLTYEAFVDFHKRYYHPSNVRIILYGNIPTDDYLAVLDEDFLSHFDRQAIDAEVSLQPRWSEPRTLQAVYPVPRGGDTASATSVTLNWLLFPVTDTRQLLRMEALTEILLGHSGSPLQKALIDSGLGQDLSPVLGLESHLRETVFSAGLRGTDADKAPAIEAVVTETLQQLVTGGIGADLREGALRKIDFRNRELKSGPNGMRVMSRSLRQWVHGGHPAEALHFSAAMDELRADLAANPRLLEEMVESRLLQNSHRSTVIVVPAPGYTEDADRELEAELALTAEGMNAEERGAVESAQHALELLQATPDRAEDVAKIPYLSLSDIPKEVDRIPTHVAAAKYDVPVYRHEIFTNGIIYLDFAFDLEGLPREWESFLNLFASAFTEVGLPGLPFDAFQTRANMETGGISTFVSNQYRSDNTSRVQGLFTARVRLLESQIGPGIDLFEQLLTGVDFADTDRLRQVFDEVYTELRAALIPSGHYFAGVRAAAGLSSLAVREDRIGGVGQYSFLRGLHDESDAALSLAPVLSEMANWVVVPSRLAVNITADKSMMQQVAKRIDRAIDRICESRGAGCTISRLHGEELAPPEHVGEPELLLTSSGVSHVALAVRGRAMLEEGYAAQEVLAHLLRTGPLWERVRMAGGAYGAFSSSKTLERIFAFGSYRDPHTVRTLEAFRESLTEITKTGIEQRELELSLISLLGRELRPLVPRERGFVSFRRQTHGITDDLRQRVRDDLRAVSPDDVKRAAAFLLERLPQGSIATLGGTSAREQLTARYSGLVCTDLGI